MYRMASTSVVTGFSVLEVFGGTDFGRRVVSGRRARRRRLLAVSWLCGVVCARRQPAGS